jgi:hypothetical protein
MSKPPLRPQIVSDLVWQTIDDDAVVVSPQSGTIRVLNGIGTVIWLMLSEGEDPAQILAHLVEQYDVSLEQAQDDLQAFLNELQARELITWQP